MRLASSSQLGTVLAAAEQEGATVDGIDSRVGIVTDRQERVTLWGRWLREAAAATKQRCGHCASQSLRKMPGLMALGNWWCSTCLRISSPVVDRHEYDSLPFSTAGIAQVPGGATLRGPVEREDLDWHLARLSKRRAPGPDEVPYELLATAPDELKVAP